MPESHKVKRLYRSTERIIESCTRLKIEASSREYRTDQLSLPIRRCKRHLPRRRKETWRQPSWQ